MSTIDDRVVRLSLDNEKFLSKIKQTIETMTKLKESLKLDKVNGTFDNLQKSAEKVNFKSIENDVGTISSKFDALGLIATGALQKIGHQVTIVGERIVSSFTIDPIKSGFEEYETQINSVQTILANTESKGSTLKDVNKALNELNKYADMTIYNFTEMTRNIGTFTAAGVDLKTSTAAIKGIANLAAVSGSTSQQASTAMYQLSQALASGTVKLQDWNSVVNAGMGGQVFQDALKETARVHGVKIDEMIKKEGSFRETLKNEWLTSSVLTETLSKFTGDMSKKQLKSIGYTDKQIKSIVKMGKTASDAATKVKTFTQLKDTLMEAAQSGWTQSWEYMIGDFNKAKGLFTKVSNALGGIIEQTSNARNAVLKEAVTSGWTQLMEKGIKNSKMFQKVVKKTAKSHGVDVKSIIKDNGSFSKSLKTGWVTSDILAESISKMTKKVSKMSKKQRENAGFTDKQVKSLKKLNKKVKQGKIDLDEYADKLMKGNARSNVINGISRLFTLAAKSTKPIKQAFDDFIPPITGKTILDITYNFRQFTKSLTLSKETMGQMRRIFGAGFAVLRAGGEAASTVMNALVSSLSQVGSMASGILGPFATFADDIVNIVAKVTEFAHGLGQTFEYIGQLESVKVLMETWSELVDLLKSRFTDIGIAIREFVGGLTDSAFGESPKLFDLITSAANDLAKILTKVIKSIIAFVHMFDALPSARDVLSGIGDVFGHILTVVGLLKSPFSFAFTVAKKFIDIITDSSLDTSALIFEKISEAISAVSGFIGGAASGMSEFVSSLKDLPITQEVISRMSQSFNTLRTNASAVASSVASKIVSAFSKAGTTFKRVISDVKNFASEYAKLPTLQEAASAAQEFVNKTFETGASLTENLGKLVGELVNRAKEVADVNFGGILNNLNGVKDKIIETVDVAGKLDRFKDFQDNLQGGTEAFFNSTSSTVGTIKDMLLQFVNWVKDKIASVTLGDIIAAGVGASFMSFAFTMSKFITTMDKAIAPFTGIAASFKGIADSTKNFINAMAEVKKAEARNATIRAISDLIKSVALLAGALVILAQQDPERLKTAGIVLGSISAGLIILTTVAGNLLSKVKPAVLTAFASVIGSVTGSLILVAVALKIVSTIPADRIASSLIALGGAMAELAAFVIITSKLAPNMASGSASLLSMGLSLILVAKAMTMLGEVDQATIFTAVGVLTAMGIVMAIISRLSGKSDAKAALGVVAIALSMLVMVKAIKKLSDIPADQCRTGLERFAVLVGAIAALFIASSVAGKNAAKAGVAVLLISVAMHVLVGAIEKMASLDSSTMERAGEVVKQILLVFGVITASTALAGKNAARAGVAIGIMAASMLLIVAAIAVLTKLDPEGVQRGVDAITRLMFMFSLLIASTFLAKGAQKVVTSLTIAVIALAGCLAVLSLINPENLAAASTALTILMAAMAGLGASTKLITGKGMGGLAVLTGVVVVLAVVVKQLSDIPWQNAISASASMSLLLTSMSASCLILQYVNPVAAAKGALGLIALMSILGGFFASLGLLNELTGGAAADFIQNGIPVLEALGSAIGGFIGSLAGSLAGAFAGNAIAEVGTGMSNFMTNVQGFIDGANKIDAGSLEGVKTLVEMIMLLMGAEFVNQISSFMQLLSGDVGGFLSGASGMQHLGSDLIGFAEAMSAFVTAASAINEDELNKTKDVMGTVFSLLESIQPEGGVKGFLEGSASEAIGNLSNVLPGLVYAVKSMGMALSEGAPNKQAIDAFLPVAKSVFTLLDSIKEEGGVVDWWGGSSTEAIRNLSNVLPALVKAVCSFSDTLTGENPPNYEAIEKSIDPIKKLFTLLDAIHDEGGVVDWWGGSASEAMKNFAPALEGLGTAIVSFSKSITSETIDWDAITKSVDPIKNLFTLLDAIHDEGGVVDWWGGSASEAMKNLGPALRSLGVGLGMYSAAIANANFGQVEASLPAVRTLAEISQTLKEESALALFDSSHSQALKNFGGALLDVGAGIHNYGVALVGTDFNLINASLPAVETIGSIATHLRPEGIISKTFGDTGSTALRNFGKAIPHIAVGLRDYSTILSEADFGLINASLPAVETIGSIAEKLKPEGVISKIFGDTTSTALTNLSGSLPSLGEALNKFSSALGKDFKGDIAQQAALAVETLSQIKIGDGTKSPIERLQELWAGEDKTDSLEKMGETFNALGSCINSFATNLTSEVFQDTATFENVQKIVDFVKSINGEINKTAIEDFVSVMTTYGDWGLSQFSKSLSEVQPGISENLDKLSTMLNEKIPDISAQAEKLKSALSGMDLSKLGSQTGNEYTSSMNNALTKGMDGIIPSVVAKFQEMYNKAKAVFSSAASDFGQIGTNMANALTAPIEGIDLSDEGANIVQGLVRGIERHADKVRDAMNKITSGIKGSVTTTFEIHSPSRLFMRYGRYLDEGLAIGIDKYAKTAIKSAGNLGKDTIEETNRVLSEVGKMSDVDLDYQPSIRPVLDTSMIESGVGKMNALLQTNTEAIKLNADMSTKMSSAASNATFESDVSKRLMIEQDNAKIVSAIAGLDKTLRDYSGDTNIINGVTYDDGTNIGLAVGGLAAALKIDGRS